MAKISRPDKAALRMVMRTKRGALLPSKRADLDEAIRRQLGPFLLPAPSLTLVFYPAKGEPDLLPLISDLLRAACGIAFPGIHEGRMRFYPISDPALNFRETYCGIPQPEISIEPVSLFPPGTVCLVPGLAFSRDGHRVGYGGGFYDKHLATFPGISIGIAYSFQVMNALPTFDHDHSVDYICTEEGVSDCRPFKEPPP